MVSTAKINFDENAAKSYFSTLFKRPDAQADIEEANPANIQQPSQSIVQQPHETATTENQSEPTMADQATANTPIASAAELSEQQNDEQIAAPSKKAKLIKRTDKAVCAQTKPQRKVTKRGAKSKTITDQIKDNASASAAATSSVVKTPQISSAGYDVPDMNALFQMRTSEMSLEDQKKEGQRIKKLLDNMNRMHLGSNVAQQTERSAEQKTLTSSQPVEMATATKIQRTKRSAQRKTVTHIQPMKTATVPKRPSKRGGSASSEASTAPPKKRSVRNYKLVKKCGDFGFHLEQLNSEWFVSLVVPKSSAFRKLAVNDRIDGLNGISIDRYCTPDEMKDILSSSSILAVKISRDAV